MKSLAKNIIPGSFDLPLRYLYKVLTRHLDFEITVLKKERPNCFRAIDIGTNIGIYSYAFSKYCKKVESFEPVAQCTEMLRAYAEKRENVTVHNVGLSNRSGFANLYVPIISNTSIQNVGLASVNDPGGNRNVIQIPLKCLDDYEFTNVGIIKVDVEGHEFEVLQGAIETIRRERPLLLVEIEQRHLNERSIEDVFDFILSLGYCGGYYLQKHYYPLDTFTYDINQKPYLDDLYSGNYINNFIFRPVTLLSKTQT